ncbi:class I SAM-dependent methyltransferase [Planococcus sp. 107-1]|uniref:class I SAM-dependent methyltransferase n=1 Tax=Planococcus sp. 107-1 TaxID=2908840 RepID=UPI001F23F5E2|nr:class I SAM-dependent methyltransferase [Planococcus sp. 107-1]UJF25705.1 class I SAM-dependent methyltransferase [Planococcus sp. 107-1]
MKEKYSSQAGHSNQLPRKTGITQLRAAIGGNAYGHVLEIGSGTGANFPFYKNALSVDAIEPDERRVSRSRKQVKMAKAPIHLHVAKAEQLPFNENVFDTVVATLVFCTIPDPQKALEEIQRVAKPGARIFFLNMCGCRSQ